MEYCPPDEGNSVDSYQWKPPLDFSVTSVKPPKQLVNVMEYHAPAEVNSQDSYPAAHWKPPPPLDYSTASSKSPKQQTTENSAPTETSEADRFPSCQSKPGVNSAQPSDAESNEQNVRNAQNPYSGLNIYSSEDSDEDICTSRLKKTRSILEELFSEDSNELLDSASDSGKELPSNSKDETHESCSETSKSPKPSSSSKKPKTNGRSTNIRTRGAVAVNRSHRKVDGKRVYNKKHYCLFCSKPFSKMARHLEDVHAKEEEVAKARGFPKGSKERRLQLDELRLRGNYKHNIAVLKSGKGDLVPCKRPRGVVKASDFMHCAHCQGLFNKRVLWRHMKVCKLSPNKTYIPKPGKNRTLSIVAASQPVPANISPALWTILSFMVPDEVTDAVKNDSCILQMGEYWLNKSGAPQQNQGCIIRQKLRELGKLLVTGRKVASLKKLEDFLDPYNCMQVVEAVRQACEYNSETNTYKIPSLAKKLSIWLVQLSRLVRAKVVVPKDSSLAQKLRDFQKIHEDRWNDLLWTSVSKNTEDVKFKTPMLLAFTEDVQKLHTFLNKTQDERMTQLSSDPSTKYWSDLAKVCLTQVVLFNRSREGEVSSMTLATFLSRDSADPPTDIDWALTEVEKQLCRHFYKIVIRPDGARPVPILLTLKMLRALQLLAEKREVCGVLKENPYVFARPSSNTHYRSSDCVRVAATACGAKDAYALTCGKLRKRIATLSTVLNLGDPEINQLANFLGHELIVHEEYYPLPERTLQLAKVYKVLTAMEQGRMMEFMGKNFSDISVQPNEELELCNERGRKNWESSAPVGGGTHSVNESAVEETVLCVTGSSAFTTSPPGPKRKEQKKRKTWSMIEVQAVERHMKDFITSCRVPGKTPCENCIRAEPLALKNRDWQSVKFYVYNRIMAQKRDGTQKV